MSDESAAGGAEQSAGTHAFREARGILPWQEGDEPAEIALRRARSDCSDLEAELARLRELAIAGLEAAKVPMEYGGDFPLTWACEHNAALDVKIAEIRGGGNG